jgi:hypothetical protein
MRLIATPDGVLPGALCRARRVDDERRRVADVASSRADAQADLLINHPQPVLLPQLEHV